jgi:cysteine-rich repeat protein
VRYGDNSGAGGPSLLGSPERVIWPDVSKMVLRALIASLLVAPPLALAALPPYDFTGHWSGVILAASQAFTLEGDLAMTTAKKFRGEVVVEGVPCTLRGKRRQTVKLRLKCADGTRGKLKGVLDVANDSVIGTGRLKKSGGKASAQFAIEKAVVAVCGNGTLEDGEQCDDGNTLPGDGCDATCQTEVDIVTELDEVEPNGTPAQATDVASLPALAHGSITAGGDEDFYRIVITGSDLVLETFDDGGPGSCGSDTDTVIELRGPDGSTVVAIDDDGGVGPCSRVERHDLTPGTYYPCVRSFLGGAIPAYQLRMIGP